MGVAPAPSKDRSKTYARLAGSSCAGIVELFGFHPVDTVAKRLMNNQSKIETVAQFKSVIFKNYVDANVLQKYTSLFPGLSFAAGYKILQRIYKFGGQPYMNDLMNRYVPPGFFEGLVGPQYAKPVTHAAAGSLIGIGEIVLLPLDVLKIKAQNNPDAIQGRSMLRILSEESPRSLFRGAGWTAARNAPGSFALFGAAAFVKEKVFCLEDYNSATFLQNFAASTAGGVASIVVSNPLDVIKTRVQAKDFSSKVTGSEIVLDLIRKEGMGAFFKGLIPKTLIVGPKLIFSFTVAQHLIGVFETSFTQVRTTQAQAKQG